LGGGFGFPLTKGGRPSPLEKGGSVGIHQQLQDERETLKHAAVITYRTKGLNVSKKRLRKKLTSSPGSDSIPKEPGKRPPDNARKKKHDPSIQPRNSGKGNRGDGRGDQIACPFASLPAGARDECAIRGKERKESGKKKTRFARNHGRW